VAHYNKFSHSTSGYHRAVKNNRGKDAVSLDEISLAMKPRKAVPHEFVLEAISSLSPRTNPMFGCLAVYVKEKIVFILRDKNKPADDDGVWLATTHEHHGSLRRDFPNMRSIQVLGKKKITGWQVLPAEAPDFEEAALRACDFVMAGDPRIGKIPGERPTRAAPKTGKSTARKKDAKKKSSSAKVPKKNAANDGTRPK
jgi:hypothetical protein